METQFTKHSFSEERITVRLVSSLTGLDSVVSVHMPVCKPIAANFILLKSSVITQLNRIKICSRAVVVVKWSVF